MNYLLDTDTVSYAIRGYGDVSEHLASIAASDVSISSITYAELMSGAEQRASLRLINSIDNFVSQVAIVPFDSAAAREFGRIAALLIKRGTPIGDFDILIAAHAVSLGCVLVTNNVRHFSRVHGLKIENWT